MGTENELDLLRKLYRGTFTKDELLEVLAQNRDRYRVLFQLVQQPKLPERDSLSIITKLFPMDLMRVIKNKRVNPNIRKRAEMEFRNKYRKFALGEKRSYMKIAPTSLLEHFIEEKDQQVLEHMLGNPYFTEELILKMINRKTDRTAFYQILADTEWYKRPQVAEAVALDLKAPIRILTAIIPFLNSRQLEQLYIKDTTHQSIKNYVLIQLQKRKPIHEA